jgi:hypothetical protein
VVGAVFRFCPSIGIYKTGRFYMRGQLKVEDPSASVANNGRVSTGSAFQLSRLWMKRRDSSKEAQKTPNRVGHLELLLLSLPLALLLPETVSSLRLTREREMRE